MNLVVKFFFLAVFASFSASVKASMDKRTKILCNEELMKEVRTLVNKIPDQVAEKVHLCIKELEPDLATQEMNIKCPKGENKQVPPKYFNVIKHPIEFADCGTSVIQEMEEGLSPSERENVKSIEEEGMKIFNKISSMY